MPTTRSTAPAATRRRVAPPPRRECHPESAVNSPLWAWGNRPPAIVGQFEMLILWAICRHGSPGSSPRRAELSWPHLADADHAAGVRSDLTKVDPDGSLHELDVGLEGWDDAVLPDALPACKGPHHSLEVSEMDGDRKREIEEKLHECVERKPMDVVIATTGVLVPGLGRVLAEYVPHERSKELLDRLQEVGRSRAIPLGPQHHQVFELLRLLLAEEMQAASGEH